MDGQAFYRGKLVDGAFTEAAFQGAAHTFDRYYFGALEPR
jgi:hypothetical protein